MSEYQTDRMSIDIFKINWCLNLKSEGTLQICRFLRFFNQIRQATQQIANIYCNVL